MRRLIRQPPSYLEALDQTYQVSHIAGGCPLPAQLAKAGIAEAFGELATNGSDDQPMVVI